MRGLRRRDLDPWRPYPTPLLPTALLAVGLGILAAVAILLPAFWLAGAVGP